jgi:hypothetical protein
VTERSGRFGKFGFLADPAKFPRSHGSRASTIGCPKHCHPADTQRHGHFDRLSAHGLGMPASEKLHMNDSATVLNLLLTGSWFAV